MEDTELKNYTEILRLLPPVDSLLRTKTAQKLVVETGGRHLTVLARSVAESMRQEIQEKIARGDAERFDYTREELLNEAEIRLLSAWRSEQNTSLQRVINATGVIIHTNLGRAPLSEAAIKALNQATGYCALEYNVETGKRGRRGARAEHLLAELTGAESALIVNNCAAAALLILTALASGGEGVISRGELVEIGGDFRVPDVMAQSNAKLVEVGTTNRTRVADYENAITENTRILLKIHPSNFRIIGFTAAPSVKELADLAHRNDIILYEDAGSGAMFDLSTFGLNEEPIISHSIAAGADVVSFSGDKLLGGVQSGLIVGRREVIERLRKHPLYRTLRVDKLAYAVLEATLEAFRRDTVMGEIPVLRMLSMTYGEMNQKAYRFVHALREVIGENTDLGFEAMNGHSVIGGGSAPATQPTTILLALRHKKLTTSKLEQALRNSTPPVVARIVDDKVLLDLRTVTENEELELLEILAGLAKVS